MRISDMVRREPFQQILCDTLSREWSQQLGRPVKVAADADGQGRRWLAQSTLNACFVPRIGAAPRRFLRENFRNTSVPGRVAGQWALGTLLASRPGLLLAAKQAFSVSTSLPNEDMLLVVPGNQRIRIFDFATGRTRALLKIGFDPRTMRREIETRATGRPGPFPRIHTWSADGLWFEESILDAYPLPRRPPGTDPNGYERQAAELLENWAAPSRRDVVVAGYTGALAVRVRDALGSLGERLPDAEGLLTPLVEILTAAAGALGKVMLADTHGDLQGGNILIERESDRVVLIDWEHAASRSVFYDRLVYGLASRAPAGLAERVRTFVTGGAAHHLLDALPHSSGWRASAAALFLLEDLVWHLEENTSGPFLALSPGLPALFSELSLIAPWLTGFTS